MEKRGVLILLGESFRLGEQGTRNIGSDESYNAQIKASFSHVSCVQYIKQQYNIPFDIYIATYNTKFNDTLLDIYKQYSIGYDLYDDRIGTKELINRSISKMNITLYDFILLVRIDICLKDHFLTIFNPLWDTIRFASICFMPYHKTGVYPRVNPVLLWIPKKYYIYIKEYIDISCHDVWKNLMCNTTLTIEDVDTMIDTYHDSDSAKDYNPMYYIVNRYESLVFHTPGEKFNKYTF